MKLLLLNLLFLCLISITSSAQSSYAVKGSVVDTSTNVKLLNTSVSVIRAKDSILIKYTRTGENGTFAFNNLPKGKFFLLFTYPGYADYVEHFTLDSTKNVIDFKSVKLILKANLLKDVVIQGRVTAIKIKGDTTEFNAAAYKIQANDKVEDLLKQLQGIQIDKDGKITAQGATVSKVLVDGEEFFGDDPTLVTKNLRADMVDKVQLFDKKSDQAAFTGIDDGQKTKTINIKLKEDKKNGYFGKLDLGGGTDDFYQLQGMFNSFKGKQKIAAYGTLANTGKIGLGWGDSDKYGASSLQMVDGGFYIGGGGDALDSFDGQYGDRGIPVARTGGGHYDTKWNSDKESINANYKIGSLTVDGTSNTLSQNNQPDGVINTNSDESFHNYMFRQKFDVTYNIKLDTTMNLKLATDGTLKNSEKVSNYLAVSRRGDGSLLNTSERSLTNNVRTQLLNGSAFWTKKFKKKGRTLSVNISEAITHTESKGYSKSDNEFYSDNKAAPDSSRIVDQYKTSLVKSNLFNSVFAYTEPLAKGLSLVLNYGFALNNSTSDRKSFNKSANGEYQDFDPLYSNNFKLDQTSNQGGAFLNLVNNKTTLNVGSKVTNVEFEQKNLYAKTTFDRTFVNWNPSASYRYKFSQQKSLGAYYSGSTSQPTIDQIQPILDNTDPLNITLGNQNLRPSFRNSFSVNYNSYKMLSGSSIYVNGSYSFTNNPIVSNTTTDASGKSTFQSVNLSGKKASSWYMYFDTDRKIFFGMNGGINANVNSNTSYNYVNGELNESKSSTYTAKLSISRYKEKKFQFRLNGGPTYTTNQSSLQKQINDNGWGFNGDGYFTVYLPGKFEIGGNSNYEYRAKTQSFDESFSKVIVNANISKKFLKSEALKFSLSGNDLLGQNVGFDRSARGNMITQNSYTTIKRYFLASIVWDFNKMGGSAPKK